MGDRQIKNVIFDFGGVMVGYDPAGWVESLFGRGEAYACVMENLFESALWAQMDLGNATREEVNAASLESARRAGVGREMAYVQENWFENVMTTKDDTVALVRALRRAGLGVYYLTNMHRDLWESFRRRGLTDLFDGGVASFEVHLVKPDRRIYRLLLESCGLQAQECVFFDDMEQNVAGARLAGIDASVFTDAARARRELRERGIGLDNCH